jgi:hypothetical protein
VPSAIPDGVNHLTSRRRAKLSKVETLFCRTKDFGRIVLRECKTSRSYAGFVSLAFALVNLQLCP